MGCRYSCLYRSKLRAEYDVDEGECPDFLVHCCCEHLALCQEYRELKNRGFDLGIGKCAALALLRFEFSVLLASLLGRKQLFVVCAHSHTYRTLMCRTRICTCEGWEANMDRQRRGVAGGTVMGAPAIPLGMIR